MNLAGLIQLWSQVWTEWEPDVGLSRAIVENVVWLACIRDRLEAWICGIGCVSWVWWPRNLWGCRRGGYLGWRVGSLRRSLKKVKYAWSSQA